MMRLRQESSGENDTTVRPLRDGIFVALLILGTGLVSAIALFEQSTSVYTNQLRSNLLDLAVVAAAQIDVEAHEHLTHPDQEAGPLYAELVAPLQQIQRSLPHLRYVYTVRLTDDGMHFVLDASKPGDHDGDGVDDHSYLMESYADPDPSMLEAARTGQTQVTQHPHSDQWGTFISAYAPLRDRSGRCVAILGVDRELGDYHAHLAELWTSSLIGLIPVVLLSVIVGFGVYGLRGHTQRVRRDRDAVAHRLAHTEAENHKLAIVAARTDNAVIITDRAGRIEWVNDGFTRITGYTLSEVRNQSPGSILQGPETDAATVDQMREHLRRGEGFHTEILNYGKSGRTYWLDIEVQPIYDDDGSIMNFMAIESDITERKRIEQALRENEQRLRAVIETTPDCVKVVAADGTILEMNSAGLAMVGASTASETVGRSVFTFIAPEYLDAYRRFHARVCGGESARFEYEIQCLNGSRLWMDSHAAPLHDPAGGTRALVAVTRDVTKQKRAEIALQEANRRFEQLAEATCDTFWEYDPETDAIWWGDNLYSHFGYDRGAGPYDRDWWVDRVHPDDRGRVVQSIDEALAADSERWTAEYRFQRADGTFAEVLDRGFILRDETTSRAKRMIGVVIDQTDLRQATREIAFRKALLESQSEASPDGILVVSLDGRVLNYNRRFLELWRLPEETLSTGDDHQALTRGADAVVDRDAFLQRVRELYDSPGDCSTDEIEFKDGRIFHRYTAPVHDGSGAYYGRVWFFRDVTAQREAEAMLRQHKIVLENSNAVLFRWIATEGWPVKLVTDNVSQFGYEASDFLDGIVPFAQIVHPDDLERVAAEVAAHSASDVDTFEQEYRIVCQDDSVRWIYDRTTIDRAEDGRPRCFEGVIIDITERKLAEEELARSERFLQSTLDALSAHIAILNERGVIIGVNRAWRRFAEDNAFTADASFGLGMNYLEACDRASGPCSGEAAEVAMGLRRVLQREADQLAIEYPCHSPNEERWFVARATRFESEGRVYAVIAHENITQRKQAEQAMERARVAAEDASRAKSEFLANMSHEIRTPMTAILGYADLLLEQDIPEKDRLEHVKTIHRNGQHLLGLINDILDLSKIETGRLTVEHIDCSPIEIFGDVVSLMRSRAEQKELHLAVEYSSPIPATIKSDPTRLRQILINLLGNAIKFTEEGGVRIVVKHEMTDDENSQLRIEVVDTGIGMSESQARVVFDPFTQADASTTRKYGGTGLGLSISRRLAEMLGGTIEVQSDLGEGSTFVVTIACGKVDPSTLIARPHEAATAAAQPDAPAETQTTQLRGSILLAEDGPDNQRLLTHLLSRAGAVVTLAKNGREAVDVALEAEQNETPFDLIFMDMQMPVLDGYGAVRELREAGYQRPIVALTAHAMASDRDKCLEIGCDGHLAKPVDRAALITTASQHLTASAGAPSDDTTAAHADAGD